jgi:hypothetical protein
VQIFGKLEENSLYFFSSSFSAFESKYLLMRLNCRFSPLGANEIPFLHPPSGKMKKKNGVKGS